MKSVLEQCCCRDFSFYLLEMKTRKNRIKKITEGSAGEIYINSTKPKEIIKKAHNLSAEESGLWLDGPISTYEMADREAIVHKKIWDAVKTDKKLASHIPKFISYNKKTHTLIMEKKEGKNLAVLANSKYPEFDETIKPTNDDYPFKVNEVKEIFKQIAMILGKLRKLFPGFVHGDFNPANVMVSFDPIHVVLIDFSFVGSDKKDEFPKIEETKDLEEIYDIIRLLFYFMGYLKNDSQVEAKHWLAKLASLITKKPFLTSQKTYENKWFEEKLGIYNTKKLKQSSKIKTYEDVVKLIDEM
jgi:serine/threonine protein kinase